MKYKFYVLRCLAILALGFLITCSKSEKNPFGLESLDQNKLGAINQFVIYGSTSEAALAIPDSIVGTSDELLIGQIKEDKSSILVRFGTLVDEVGASTVRKAHLFFKPLSKIADQNPVSMDVKAHLVNTSWEEENVNPLDIFSNIDLSVLGTGSFPDSLVKRDSLILDTDLVQQWLDGSVANNGLLVMSESANHVAVYSSDETSYLPQLRVVFETSGVLDSVDLHASEATSLLQTTFQPNTEQLVIGSGLGYGSFFAINADTIRKKVGDFSTINKAILTLHIDTLHTIHPVNETFEIVRLNVDDDLLKWQSNPASADSSLPQVLNYNRTTDFTIDLTLFVQMFGSRQFEDFAFRLSAIDVGKSLFRTVIHSSSVADNSMRPKLEVFYSTPQEE